MAKKETETKAVDEPIDRAIYRTQCRNYGYTGSCYKHSGYINATTHITMACNGQCRRMKLYDAKNGLKGQEFKIRELY